MGEGKQDEGGQGRDGASLEIRGGSMGRGEVCRVTGVPEVRVLLGGE